MNLPTLLFFLVILPVTFFGMSFALLLNIIDPSGNLFYPIMAWWGRFSASTLGIRVEAVGQEHYDRNGTYLIVSNHAGMGDIPIILGTIHLNLRFVAKEELGRIPVFGWALRGCGHVMIKRGQNREALQSLLKAVDTLKSGRSVHIFPEGTRSKDGQLLPFKRGAFIIAKKAGLPVLPVTIIGSDRITPKNSLRIKKGAVKLVIGKPLDPAAFASAETLQEATWQTIRQTLDENSPMAA